MASDSPFDEDYDPVLGQRTDDPVPFEGREDLERLQAAHVLLMGSQLAPPSPNFAFQAARELGVPGMRRKQKRARPWTQFEFNESTAQAFRMIGPVPDRGSTLGTRFWRAASEVPEATAALVNSQMANPAEVVAAAASAVVYQATRGESVVARERLESIVTSDDELAQRMALSALGTSLREPEVIDSDNAAPTIDQTSVCIHGTWARFDPDPWYAIGSEMHTHIRSSCSPNLFNGREYFRWSGGYSGDDRLDGAARFIRWKLWQGIQGIDTVYAHSHGGNVALSRLAAGEEISQLVLLHTPVTPRRVAEWKQIGGRVRSIVVLRTYCDLVMLVDQLRTRSSVDPPDYLPGLHVVPLPIKHRGSWFSHDYFLKRENWIKHHVSDEIRHEHDLATAIPPTAPVPSGTT